MQSRVMRAALSAAALIAFGAAAFFLVQTERQISQRLDGVRTFEQRASDVSADLGSLRAAQQAYVAAGQGPGFWIPEVATLVTTTSGAIDALRQSAASPDAASALADAASNISEFQTVDQRARDYVRSDDQLMASDVVFTEGAELAATARRQVAAASAAEQQHFDVFEAGQRRLQAYALGGAAGAALLVLAMLAPLRRPALAAATADEDESSAADTPATPSAEVLPRDAVPALKAAAQLCTDFGRVTDVDDLTKLLARAAEVMDASGLIVWMGSTSGADLRPVLAHGYPPQTLSRMPPIPRGADNAAAAAYRTGAFQIVLARPGRSNGAVVAPLLSPGGCIGALTAEMKGGSETSDSVQALAEIFAAQLAGVLAPSVPADAAQPAESKTAAG